MSNLSQAIAGLDEKKRELLALLARQKGLDVGQADKAGQAVLPLLPVPRTAESYPSSFAQERLWFLERLRPGDSGYHLPLMRILEGSVDPGALALALGGLARRHESLRTRFVERQGKPFQVIDPPSAKAAARLPVVDLSALPPARREEAWVDVHDVIAYTPFDLERGPLLRPVLARLEPETHRLLINLHHIVTDGWSLDILGREMAALYEAAREGRRAELPPLAVQYVDYAVWQRQWLQGETLERQLDHWRTRLAGAPASLELPADHPRPAVRTSRGDRIRFFLPGAGAGLSALGRRSGATLFMVLLAAWAALLRRLSGSEDINVGTPVAGRTHRALEPVVGLFVNSLVMRCDVSGDPTFEELIARAQRVAMDAFSHQDLPLQKLVEALRPERALNRGPLFQVMLTLQNTPEQAGFLAGIDPAAEKVNEVAIADFDLGLTCFEAGDALGVILEASADLFERATLRRLAGWLAHLFAGAAAAPDSRISGLPLLSEAQRHQLTAEWNDTAQPGLAADASIHGLFESQAAARPDAVALVDIVADRTWTYGELDAEAERRASHLRQLGVGGGSPVAVYLERSAAQIATFLAVLKAGGAYVPLPVDAPARRLGELLEETGSPFLVSGESRLDWLPPFWVQTVDLAAENNAEEEAWGAGAPSPAERGRVGEGALPAPGALGAPGGIALAYVLHTSGSTGVPKAVAVPHRAVVRLVRETGYARFGNPADPETFLHLAPAAFDASTLEIWGPLLNGGRLVLMPPGAPSLAGLAAALERHRVTTLWLTAGLFHRMAEDQPEALAGLRQLLAGGDVLSPVHVERVLRQAPGLRLINGYGPTENTTFTCCHLCEPTTGPAAGPLPIGRPIAGTRIHLLGPDLERLPAGAAGELCAGGSGLAWGYLGRPDLTAEKFIPDPFPPAGEEGGRLYRTGDLARLLPDGRVEFLGRLDRQVKIRGFRVEPGEIETALAEHRAVRQAAVLVREDRPGDKRLVAYVVPATEAENLESELPAALAERLPAYAVPAAFVVLGELPLTANGKVDRAALARIEPGGGPRQAEFVPPSTPTEQVLAGIWAEVLRRDQPIGAGDNFFDLSGHSLLAVQVVHQVRQTLGVDLPLRLLFEQATLADVAREIDAAGRTRRAADLPPLERAPRPPQGGLLPAGLISEVMWHAQGGPVHSVYNMPFSMRLRGDLLVTALEAAVTALAARHEALRTRFEMGPTAEGAGLLQEILPPSPVLLPLVDLSGLSGLPPEAREDLARRIAREEAVLPFDMTRAPLFRVHLLRLGEADHVLLFNVHHSISDGWSTALLQRDVAILYAACRRGAPSPLPDLPLQFADLAVWQRHAYQGAALAARLQYWRQLFADRPPAFAVPADRPAAPDAPVGSRTHLATLSVAGEEARRLRQVSREAGCTVSMTLCALFEAQVHRYNPRGDVVLTSLVAGRDRPDLAESVGPFLNVAPIRTDLSGEPTFRELLRRVRAALLEVYARQDLPFAKLIAGVLPDQPPSRTALSRVSFNVLSFPVLGGGGGGGAAPPDLGGLRLETFLPAAPEAKYDVSLNALEGPDSLLLSLLLAADRFEEESVEAMKDDLQTVLRNALNDPDTPVAALLPEPRYRPAGANP